MILLNAFWYVFLIKACPRGNAVVKLIWLGAGYRLYLSSMDGGMLRAEQDKVWVYEWKLEMLCDFSSSVVHGAISKCALRSCTYDSGVSQQKDKPSEVISLLKTATSVENASFFARRWGRNVFASLDNFTMVGLGVIAFWPRICMTSTYHLSFYPRYVVSFRLWNFLFAVEERAPWVCFRDVRAWRCFTFELLLTCDGSVRGDEFFLLFMESSWYNGLVQPFYIWWYTEVRIGNIWSWAIRCFGVVVNLPSVAIEG